MNPREIWTGQYDAARNIREDFGAQKAMGYLIGEKLLNFLEAAETDAGWRAEIPNFVDEIKDIFEPWEIAEYLETPRCLAHWDMSLQKKPTKLFAVNWMNRTKCERMPGIS